MTGQEQTEIERKYDIDELSPVPPLTDVEGIDSIELHGPFTLTAVYFDTEGLDLARERIVLRRREGGSDAGWHIKLPAVEGRTEVHWPLDIAPNDGDTVPDAVLDSVRAIVRDRPLTPLARVSTERSTVTARSSDGTALAEIADDQVAASDARGGTYRKWREWEAELLPGAPDTRAARTALLDSIETALLAAGARPSTSVAKIARALGVESLTVLPSSPGPSVLPGLLPAPALYDPASAGAVVVAAISELTDTLLRLDPRVRADAPHSVHKMRTTVRRLRSVLASYGRLFESRPVHELRDELQRLGALLGDARDAEVRGRRVSTELADAPEYITEDAVTRLAGSARRDYAAGLETVRAYLLTPRYYRLLDGLDALVDWPPLTLKAARPATAEIHRALTKAVDRLAAATASVDDSDQPEVALHEARKAARRLRYAAEAVAHARPAPITPTVKPTKKRKKAAKQAQTELAARRRRYAHLAATAKPVVKRLGDRHDRLIYLEQLGQAAQAAHEAGENTLVYGVLVARADDRDDTVAVALAHTRRSVQQLTKLAGKL